MTNLERRIDRLEQEAGAGDGDELILVTVYHYHGDGKPTVTEEWQPKNAKRPSLIQGTELGKPIADIIRIIEYVDDETEPMEVTTG